MTSLPSSLSCHAHCHCHHHQVRSELLLDLDDNGKWRRRRRRGTRFPPTSLHSPPSLHSLFPFLLLFLLLNLSSATTSTSNSPTPTPQTNASTTTVAVPEESPTTVPLPHSPITVAVAVLHSPSVSAQQSLPLPVSKTEARCVMRDICGQDGELRQNCPYDGPPVPISVKTEKDYKELCPQLFKEGNIATCCNHAQFEILRAQMSTARQLLQRCPSCYSNFANFWCQFTCSPMQSQFVDIVEVRNDSNAIYDDEGYVSRVEYYLNQHYANELFESCRNVRTSNGDFVLSILCGTSIEQCTPERLFKYIGTYNKAIHVPFTIDVIMTTERTLHKSNSSGGGRTMRPMNTTSYKCNEASDLSDIPCTCVDCLAACTLSAPFPFLFQDKCKVAAMDCQTAMSILAVCVLFGTVMITVVLHYVLQRYTAEDWDDVEAYSAKELARLSTVQLEERIVNWSSSYGRFVAQYPMQIFLLGLVPALLASAGLTKLRLTTDPVELWSSPTSAAREERDFFNTQLTPFYRTQQLIIVPQDQSFWQREDSSNFQKTISIGPVFRKNFLLASFELYKRILELNATVEETNGSRRNITLGDICFKPLYPQNPHCAVMSLFNYFQNNISKLDLEDDSTLDTFDYMDHLFDCMQNPYQLDSRLRQPCLGQFGAPVQPYVVLGDFEQPNRYETAQGLVITLLVNNHNTNGQVESHEKSNAWALAWEREFIALLRAHKSEQFSISFMSERSLEDEIARQSTSDAFTVFLSYLFMFIYVAVALGQYAMVPGQPLSVFVHSKFTLGICGIIGCVLSVSASIGLFALFRMPASLIILEVEPFLVLAVGVDNIFIFVHSYQRLANDLDSPLPDRMAQICADVMPSMMLSSLSECLCFSLGALSSMPAVQMFSLYASVAILLNFVLQLTFFLAIFVWDIRRQEAGRPELFGCCVPPVPFQPTDTESRVERWMRDYYAPALLNKFVRCTVIVFFALWLALSSSVMNRINAGLDQKMAVPEDSYVLAHFVNMERYLSVGPVVYFVLRGEFDFHGHAQRKQICSSSGCSTNSLGAQIARAAKFPERSYIAHPALNWVDDYTDWLRPVGVCCREYNNNGSFCSSEDKSEPSPCHPCTVSTLQGQPDPQRFYDFLPNFLEENPSRRCPRAGHAAYGSAVRLSSTNGNSKHSQRRVLASHYMTYHTKLRTSDDFIKAMESAQLIAQNITRDINQALQALDRPPVEVFPYSTFYVFYEQYQGIVRTAILQVILSLACIFCVTTALLGADPWSAFIIVIVIALILLNVVGSMWFWAIDFNAISVVNLVMSVGISVEFCAHIVRTFALSTRPTRVERSSEALCSVGCSVLSGITITKLGGIFVLAFAHSQVFKIYYFRMYLNIVLIGAAHGLILLPVLLSFCGPPINRRRLFLRMNMVCGAGAIDTMLGPTATTGDPATVVIKRHRRLCSGGDNSHNHRSGDNGANTCPEEEEQQQERAELDSNSGDFHTPTEELDVPPSTLLLVGHRTRLTSEKGGDCEAMNNKENNDLRSSS